MKKKLISLILLAFTVMAAACSSGPYGTNAGTDGVSGADPETSGGEDPEAPETEEIPDYRIEKRPEQVYAADLFETSDTLCLAFIGGSLTSGGISYNELMPDWPICSNKWANEIITYFVKQYRKVKTVTAVNAAIPGTTSDFASVRFEDQIASAAPDIVFIEFACNDRMWDPKGSSLYYEHMVRTCLSLDKIPSIIFVHAPVPMEEDDKGYASYIGGMEEKDRLAEHYGIKSVNVWNYVKDLYAASGTDLSITDWLTEPGLGYFRREETYIDVHPDSRGYALYSEAIKAEFESDYDGCMNRPAFPEEVFNREGAEYLGYSFRKIEPGDTRIVYDGSWAKYTNDDPYTAPEEEKDTNGIGSEKYDFPSFADGIMQTRNEGDSFTVRTSADGLALEFLSSCLGATVKVTLDGSDEPLCELSEYSIYNNMTYISGWIALPGDGAEHTVKFTACRAEEDRDVFRVGYVYERYKDM